MPQPVRPAHLAKSVQDFLPDNVWNQICAVPPEMYEQRRDIIMSCEMRTTFRCMICHGQCQTARADIHCAGTPCIHDSTIGPLVGGRRRGNKGKDAWIMVAFAKQRRVLKEPFFVSEHVPLAASGAS